jgi:predicted dehydrogenase
MESVRIGIVGSGYMGRTYAETTARYNQHCRLTAIAGGQRAAGLAEEYGVAAAPTVEALMERDDVDAVILAMPEQARLEYARLAAAAGKHVLSEKPMAPSVEQCTAIIDACRVAGVTLMVCQTARFRGVPARAKQLIDAGRIGKVWMIRSISAAQQDSNRDAARDKSWLLDPAGGGFFYDQAVHNFDMLCWLTGQRPRQVFATVATYSDLPWPQMSAMAQIAFDGGAAAQLSVCLEMPGTTFPTSAFRFQVIGANGVLDFDMYEHLDLGVDDRWERIWQQPAIDYINQPNAPARLEAHAAVTQEFVDAIREGRAPAVTGEDGRTAVALCEACVTSSGSGQAVTVQT